MKFCPKCEVKLRKGIDSLSCSKCDYVEKLGGQTEDNVVASAANSSNATLQTNTKTQTTSSGTSALEVFDDSDEEKETRSTIKIDCEKCGHDEAVWWMLQTRSADEPTTQFYRCVKCEYTWRDYS